MVDSEDKRRPRMPRGTEGSRKRRPNKLPATKRPERTTKRGQVEAVKTKRPGLLAGGITLSVRAFILTIVAAVALLVAVPVVLQWADQERGRQAMLGELEEAKATRMELEQELKNWENEEYVAAQARARLGYSNKGEIQFSVADAPKDQAEEETPEASKGPPRPWTIVLQEELKEADTLAK